MGGIDPEVPIPLYYQLKTLILEDIVSGKYRPGDQLPTEHDLCELYGISRTPTHRALAELQDEGVILRMRRRGTFVNPHWVPRHSPDNELRLMVTDPMWASQIRANAPEELAVNVVTVGYSDMRQTLTNAVAEGRAPDLALVDEAWIADLAAAGFLVAIDDLDSGWVSSEYESDFVKAFVEGRRFDGHVYAVPEEINVAGLWCRRDMLEIAGVDVPTTWEELRAAAREVKPFLPANGQPLAMPGGHVAGETTSYCLLAVLASNGVIMDDPGALDSGAAVTALRFLRSFIEDGTMGADVVTYDWLRCPNLLGNGRVAMTLGGSYEAETIAEAAGIRLDAVLDHFSFVPFPAGPQGTPATIAGGMAYAIFRQSSHPRDALRLLEHIVTTEQLVDRARGRPTIPPRHSAIDLMARESSFVAQAAELFSTSVTRPGIPDYHLVSVQLQNMLEAVLTGRLRPADAAERTAEIIAAITGVPVRHT